MIRVNAIAVFSFCAVMTSVIGSFQLLAQQLPDNNVLYLEDYLEFVRIHHPFAKQANLQIEMGDAEVLGARGSFDPQLYADIAQKYFKGDQYYSLMNGGIKIPTWFGVDFYAGYENNRGLNLNPQFSTPDIGLAYAGISVPIGQGLLMDRRRAHLRKAQLYKQMSIEEKRIILNDLIFEASNAYWYWYEAYNVQQVYAEALVLAEERFTALRRSAELGDVPPIDTLEAGIQVQNRALSLQQAQLDYVNAKALLSIYLWQEGVVPVELGDNVFPPVSRDVADFSRFKSPLLDSDNALANHPELIQYQLKIDQLKIDRRLALELVKPQLNLKYNAINQPINNNPFMEYSMRNYTWGADFNIPIFLRQGRGELKLANLYIQDASLGYEAKRALIEMRVQQANNEWATTNQQVVLYWRTVKDSERLLIGEQTKFSAGESSLFMVNAREISYISAQVKLIELLTKNQISLLKSYHTLGILE